MVATQEIALGVLLAREGNTLAQIGRALVVHHRALSAGIVQQSVHHAHLEDARLLGGVAIRVAERIPMHEIGLHRSMVGSGSQMLNQRVIEFGGSTRSPDRLLEADCVEAQAGLVDESLDLIYMDPPFGTGIVRKSGDANYDDRLSDPDLFLEWLAPCLTGCHRLLKPSGSLFVHLDYRTVHYVKVQLDRLFGRQHFVNEIIWCYSVGGKSRRSFGKKHDTILWYAKSSDYLFFPQEVAVPRKGSSHMRVVMDEDGKPVQEKTDRKTGKVYRYPISAGKVPEDWWTDIETLNHSDRERVGWPTQKPSRLLERIIKATTEPGQRVADWFSGSGTTAVTAQRLGRSFTVTDRSPEAISCAVERLQAQGSMLAGQGQAPPNLVIEGPLLSRQEGASGTRQEC